MASEFWARRNLASRANYSICTAQISAVYYAAAAIPLTSMLTAAPGHKPPAPFSVQAVQAQLLRMMQGMEMPSSASSSGCGAAAAESAIEAFMTSNRRTQDEVDALCRGHRVVVSKGFTVSPDENDHGSASPSAMTPPAPSPPRTNAQVVDTSISPEKGTAAVEASAAPWILALSGEKRNREEAHTEGPLRLDLRRVSLPDFSAPNVNADDQEATSMDQSPILLGEKEKALELELLYTEMNDIREGEMEKIKAQLSKANEVARLEKENADALREELKMVKAQLSKANEAAKLEKENAQGLRKLMLLGRR